MILLLRLGEDYKVNKDSRDEFDNPDDEETFIDP